MLKIKFSFEFVSKVYPSVQDPLSSTYQFHTKRARLFSPLNSSVSHRTPQLNTPLSSTLKTLSYTPKTPRFNNKNPSVFCVELRGSMCNWRVLVSRGYFFHSKNDTLVLSKFEFCLIVSVYQMIWFLMKTWLASEQNCRQSAPKYENIIVLITNFLPDKR